jgi:predicted HAD superfamily hydrolase/glycosyltransferase involved in cell wall biosynthesis
VERGSDRKVSTRKRKVAVVTRTKDRPLLLRRAIQSVLNQTFQDWIHVIINDGGNPALFETVIYEFRDQYQSNLLVIQNVASTGMQNAANFAIKNSDSEYVAIHDDDDSWDIDFLKETIGFLQAKNGASYQGVVTQTVQINERVTTNGPIELSRLPYGRPVVGITLFSMMGGNLFPPISFVYRRDVHKSIGFFDQSHDVLGDWDFNVRLLRKFDIGVIPKQLAFYHWRDPKDISTYGNSVTADLERHHAITARIRNSILRSDIERGRIADGYMANFVSALASLDERFSRLETGLWHLSEGRLKAIENQLRNKQAPKPALRNGDRMAARPDPSEDSVVGLSSEVIIKRALSCDVVSFDIFDTAIWRIVARPTDVFEYCQAEIRRLVADPTFPFVEIRINAERIARQQIVTRDIQDIGLDEIYDVFARITRLDRIVIENIRNLELAAEAKLCYANPRILQIYKKCRVSGIKTVFASDTYFSSQFLQDLLNTNGFEGVKIYASGEVKKTKHYGSLFTHIVKDLKCTRSRTLHIGDNLHSDFHKAKEKRIQGILLHEKSEPRFTPPSSNHNEYGPTNGLFGSLCIGLARKRELLKKPEMSDGPNDLWLSLGYEVAGPICCAYVSWLLARAKQHSIQHLYFLARDGYLFYEAFKILREKWKLPIQGQYTFSSRRLFYVPTITELDNRAFDFLLTPNTLMRSKDFISRIGLSPEQYKKEFRSVGLSISEVITTSFGEFVSNEKRLRIKRLLSAVKEDILLIARRERALLLAYLQSIGLWGEQRSGIVDIGWAASVLRCLQRLSVIENRTLNTRGFFLATWRTAQPAIKDGCKIESYLVHLDEPNETRDAIMQGVALVELIFNAPHGSIVGLNRSGDAFSPVFDRTVASYDITAQKLIRQGALTFIKDFAPIASPLTCEDATDYVEVLLQRVLLQATPQEAKYLGQLGHRDGFGEGAQLRPIAKVPNRVRRLFSKHLVTHNYENCYWRPGFLAQLTHKERRVLLDEP